MILLVDIQREVALAGLAGQEALPCLGALADNVHSVSADVSMYRLHLRNRNTLLVLALAREGKLVLRLAIRNLVDTEPFIRCPQQTR
jgi:hypothetical protein